MSLYPDRHCAHRYMSPPESCEKCNGRGWHYEARPGTENDYIPDAIEVYCDCEAGAKRKEVEG